MSVIFVVLPLAFIMAGVFLVMFIRAVRRGEFDDLDTPAYRILHDDEQNVSSGRTAKGTTGANATAG